MQMKNRPIKKYNYRYVGNFYRDVIRKKQIKDLTEEYLNIIAILYGGHIESGMHKVSDYGSMTMLEAENELRIRTIMYRGERLRQKRKLKEQHAANEKALLERLKRASK